MEFLRDLVQVKNEFAATVPRLLLSPRLSSSLDGAFYGGLPERFEEIQKDSFRGL